MDNNIVTIRNNCGITQEELAKKVGVSRTTIQAWESGNSVPGGTAIKDMVKIFGCTADAILGLDCDAYMPLDGLQEIDKEILRRLRRRMLDLT